MATRCLALLLAFAAMHAVCAASIKEEYGVCPRYTVKQGDILFDIAKKLGVKPEEIISASNACGVNTTNLQISQELCLPGYIMARCKHVVRTDPDRPYCQVYTFQLGDTLKSVAELFDTTEAELTQLNSDYLAGGSLLPKAGQYIRLPGWNQKECRDFNDNDRPMCQMYIVQSGDTITTIAQRYKVDAAETLALNNLTADSTLPLNYRLKLPKWNESCPADGVPAVLPSDTVQCRVAQLRTNENLSVLAERYGTTIAAIQAVNPDVTDATKLQPGDYVNIPPFGADCVGQGQLVDVAGASAVPSDYDYNGLQGSITPEEPVEPTEPVASPSTAPVLPEDTAAPAPAPEERPADTPVAAPSPAPAESSPMPVPSPVPSPVPTPPSAVPLSAAASSLLAAALAVLAAAVLA